jgi:hypothetical protein
MFEDFLARREELMDRLKQCGNMAERREVEDQIGRLNVALGYDKEVGSDDLIDKWERELAEGKIPDLNER